MILALIKRNLKSYFRDRATVFFSLLGALIIILLYVLFLGNLIEGSASQFAGDDARFLIDTWIMGGVITASSVTTTLGAYSMMVQDQEKKTIRDFYASPLKSSSLILSYLISAMLIGLIMSVFTLVLAQFYILLHGSMLSLLSVLKVLGVIILSVLASSSMIFFFMMFVKSSNAMSAISITMGTFVGFLTGVYLPIGQLPASVQSVVKAFPPSHAAVLLRQIMMNEAMPLEQVPSEFKSFLGVQFTTGTTIMSVPLHLLVLIGTAVVFFILSMIVIKFKKEKE